MFVIWFVLMIYVLVNIFSVMPERRTGMIQYLTEDKVFCSRTEYSDSNRSQTIDPNTNTLPSPVFCVYLHLPTFYAEHIDVVLDSHQYE